MVKRVIIKWVIYPDGGLGVEDDGYKSLSPQQLFELGMSLLAWGRLAIKHAIELSNKTGNTITYKGR